MSTRTRKKIIVVATVFFLAVVAISVQVMFSESTDGPDLESSATLESLDLDRALSHASQSSPSFSSSPFDVGVPVDPTRSFTGTVVDLHGGAVRDASIFDLSVAKDDGDAGIDADVIDVTTNPVATTDADGYFAFAHATSLRMHRFEFRAMDHHPIRVELRRGEPETVVMPPLEATLSVIVVDVRGQRTRAVVEVVMAGDDGTEYVAKQRTDSAGDAEFTVPFVPGRIARLVAVGESGATSWPVRLRDHFDRYEVKLVLRRAVEVVALDAVDGTPIVDAEVAIYFGPPPSRKRRPFGFHRRLLAGQTSDTRVRLAKARTDENGVVRLPRINGAGMTWRVGHEAYVGVEITEDLVEKDHRGEVRLERRPVVEGEVVWPAPDFDTSGAEIAVRWDEANEIVARFPVNEDGTYRLVGLDAHQPLRLVLHGDFIVSKDVGPRLVLAPGEVRTLPPIATEVGRRVTGSVFDGRGRPIADGVATLRFRIESGRVVREVPIVRGRVTAMVPKARVTVKVDHGNETEQVRVGVDDDEFELRTKRRRRLSSKVVQVCSHPDGSRAPDVVLMVARSNSLHDFRIRTDAKGEFRRPFDTHGVRAAGRGFGLVRDGENPEWGYVRVPRRVVSGVVRDPFRRRPIRRVKVTWKDLYHRYRPWAGEGGADFVARARWEVRTDRDGRFELSIPVEIPGRLMFSRPGFEAVTVGVEGGSLSRTEIMLDPSRRRTSRFRRKDHFGRQEA